MPTSRGAELLLDAIRNEFGGVQHDAAMNLKVSETSISHLVSGKRAPSLKMAVFFQRAFGIPCPAWLEPPSATIA